jgi:hypothetical protein
MHTRERDCANEKKETKETFVSNNMAGSCRISFGLVEIGVSVGDAVVIT